MNHEATMTKRDLIQRQLTAERDCLDVTSDLGHYACLLALHGNWLALYTEKGYNTTYDHWSDQAGHLLYAYSYACHRTKWNNPNVQTPGARLLFCTAPT